MNLPSGVVFSLMILADAVGVVILKTLSRGLKNLPAKAHWQHGCFALQTVQWPVRFWPQAVLGGFASFRVSACNRHQGQTTVPAACRRW